MFQRQMCKHPDVQTVAYTPHTYLETQHWLKGAVLLGMAPRTFAGGKVYPGYGSVNNARTYLVDCILRNVPDFRLPGNDRALVFEGWEALCHKFARPVFFEKSPQLLSHWAGLSLLLDWIQQTSYRVKVIGLTRNPLSVQYSANKLFHTDPVARQFGWLEMQKNLLAFQALLPKDDIFLVNYEQIVAQPQRAFTAICEFIGVSSRSEMGLGVHADSLNKWKDDPYFTMQLDRTVRQMAEKFGYNEEELENPRKPVPPLSYRFRRRLERVAKLTLAHFRNRFLRPVRLWIRWGVPRR